MRRRVEMAVAVVVALVAPFGSLLLAPVAAHATSGTTYYIDNSGGSSCSDSNSGTSTSSPWCDFANVNGKTFGAGDEILLKSGDRWTSGMSPLGSGSAGSPIVIGCYGSTCGSNWPVIAASSSSVDDIYLENPSYWDISQVTLTDGDNGIHLNFSQLGNEGITIDWVYIYDTSGSGILFDGYNENPQEEIPSDESIYKDVSISDVTVQSADGNGIAYVADYPNTQMVSAGYPNAQQDVSTEDVQVYDVGCSALTGANLEDSLFMDIAESDDDTTGCSGTANYWTSTSDVDWINGIYEDMPFTSSSDNGAFVIDNHVSDLQWLGDYFGDDAASGLEVAENPCFDSCTSSTNSGVAVEESTFVGDSTADDCNFYGDISPYYGPYTGGEVENNSYDDNSQTCNAFVRGSDPNLTVSENTAADAADDVYDAPAQYGSTQGGGDWSYISDGTTDGSGVYSDMSYDSATGDWTDGAGGMIDQFDLTPPSNSLDWVGRAWTAPKDGTVQIRGWLAMNTTGGNGAVAAIDLDGDDWLWHSSISGDDQSGMATDVGDVSVTAGEQIHFYVNDGGWDGGSYSNADDTVSWAPSIVYTSS